MCAFEKYNECQHVSHDNDEAREIKSYIEGGQLISSLSVEGNGHILCWYSGSKKISNDYFSFRFIGNG